VSPYPAVPFLLQIPWDVIWSPSCHIALDTSCLGFCKEELSQVPVAYAYNPSYNYSGGRDQEDHGSNPAWGNSSPDPLLEKNPSQKRAGGVAQGVGPEFKKQYRKKKKLFISRIFCMFSDYR
jgi:hypothetical protein